MHLIATPVSLQGESFSCQQLGRFCSVAYIYCITASRWITSRHSKDAGEYLYFFVRTALGSISYSFFFFACERRGHGFVDIRSRLMDFCLQAAQRLLYNSDITGLNPAVALLRKADNMELDKHLFLLELNEATLKDLTPFYRSMMG